MYEEVQEGGEGTDKGYKAYQMAVGRKKKGYSWGSNMDMDMEMEQVCQEFEGFDRTEQVELQVQRMDCGQMDLNKQSAADEDIVTEQVSEVEKILQDLENEVVDETLPQLTEDDVAFDMDEVVVEEEDVLDEDVLDEDESDTDGEENDIGWIDMDVEC